MKRILNSILLAFAAAGTPFVHTLMAQEHRAIADVPFSFVVADRTLPAGKYDVSQLRDSSPVFALRNTQGDALFVQMGNRSAGTPQNPSLTFTCQKGSDCVLTEIAPPDSQVAYGLRKPSANQPHSLHMASLVSIKLQ